MAPTHSWKPLQVHYRRQASSLKPLIAGAVFLSVAATGIAWQGPNLTRLLPAAPTVTVTATPAPAPAPAPASPYPVATPTTEPEAPAPREGHDYTFMNTINGEPVTWGCAEPILLATRGDVPPGTQEALELVVGILQNVSDLPLTVIAPDHDADITVYYVAPGTTRGHITLDGGDNLGKAGPSITNARIVSGIALLRNDIPTTDPATPDGQAVLLHELAHTLGLSHADQTSGELMSPLHTTGTGAVLGPGDITGLQLLGCP